MSALGQLSMFEPSGTEALQLLQRYVREAEHQCALADRFELLGMRGAVARADALAAEAMHAALVMAFLLDFEAEAGL